MLKSFLPILFITLVFLVITLLIVKKVRIEFKSFFRRGLKTKDDKFGCWVFTNSQGSGKTASVVNLVNNLGDKCIYFSNFKIDLPFDIHYFDDMRGCLDVIYSIDDKSIDTHGKQVVIIFDELFAGVDEKHIPPELRTILSQLRKRHIILLCTAQVWSKLPIMLRYLCKYQVDCKKVNLFFNSYFINEYHKAGLDMKWNNDTQEYDAPIVYTRLFKANKKVFDSYDTNAIIRQNILK